MIYFAEACWLVGKLTRVGATHLHAHFGTNSATVALLARKLGGPPYSFTVHGPEEFDKPEALALGEKIRHAAFVVAISEFGRSQLYRWSDLRDWPKIHVVRCGLDASFLGQEPTPVPDVPRLVCVGRLCEQKGQLLLIEAAAQLRNVTGLKVILAGDGPMRGECKSRIRALGLQSTVTITGWQSNAQVRELIRSSRALVLPSFAEGLPVVIMEALALARPVVTTYVAGIPELVKDCVNGRLVPAGSVESLVAALHAILQMPVHELSRMGERGCTAVRERHDAAKEAAKLAAPFPE
jgi:glycosyltransferase involved in cell wall biosynthesis